MATPTPPPYFPSAREGWVYTDPEPPPGFFLPNFRDDNAAELVVFGTTERRRQAALRAMMAAPMRTVEVAILPGPRMVVIGGWERRPGRWKHAEIGELSDAVAASVMRRYRGRAVTARIRGVFYPPRPDLNPGIRVSLFVSSEQLPAGHPDRADSRRNAARARMNSRHGEGCASVIVVAVLLVIAAYAVFAYVRS